MKKGFFAQNYKTLLIVVISLLVGYWYGINNVSVSWKKYTPIVSVVNKLPPAGQTLDMKMFYDVFDRVNSDYYDKSKVDANAMLQGAINGMLATLNDPYTSFFPPVRNTAFKTQMAGEFSGIGAELSASPDNKIVVVAPLDGSPAEKAGIKAGDVIVKVNDEDTSGWVVSQAVDKIRGPKGSPISLTVLHEKSKTPVTVKIVRDTIVIHSVTSWLKNYSCTDKGCDESASGKPIAYIRLSQFGDKTNDEWLSAVNSLNTKLAGKKAAGIILDLRNNPGGYLNDAVFIASEFIPNGVVVIQEDANKNQEPMFVSRRGTLLDQPLIVLINKGSASASEIVSGALRDHNRAKLLGETSFGKGTVQQAVDLDGGASVHVSVAKWLTPNQTWVHHKGLTPDYPVAFDASASAKIASKGLDNQLQAAIEQLLK
ncbi:MAG TPA: S41 family peptidase [Patescibacteria group bacterium]|nr:S41 family peptidase [Patescibacteria group bacterium]